MNLRTSLPLLPLLAALLSVGCAAETGDEADDDEDEAVESTADELSAAGCTYYAAAPKPTSNPYRVQSSGSVRCPTSMGTVTLTLQLYSGGRWLRAGLPMTLTAGTYRAWNTPISSSWGMRSNCTVEPTKRYPHRIKITTKFFTRYTTTPLYCAKDT